MKIKIGTIRQLYAENKGTMWVDLLKGHMMEKDDFEIEISNTAKADLFLSTPTEFWEKEDLLQPFPKTFSEMGNIRGWMITDNSKIVSTRVVSPIAENRNIFPTKDQAECVLELTQLLQIHKVWIDGWNIEDTKGGFLLNGAFYETINPFMFPTWEMSSVFVEIFGEKLARIKATIGWSY